jgi:biotin carboxylase
MKPVLIVLCAGQSEYREAMLGRIAQRYRLVLVSPGPLTWERPYVIDHIMVEESDTRGFIGAAVRFADKYPVAGVFTYYEWCVEMAAAVGERLGVPQCSPAAATRCRDKWESREALRRAGVPSARSRLVRNAAEALRAAHDIGYPVVVKPRAQSASFGVCQAAGDNELAAAFDRAVSSPSNGAWEHQHGVLVEEYLDGPEISVDSGMANGTLETVIYARKILGYPPHFEEAGHVVAPPELVVADPSGVRDVVRSAHQALGVDNTVTHTELRLTSRGPRIVEVNGRSGGDFLSELGLLAGGADIAMATADIAAGRSPELSAVRNGIAGIRFLYADSSGVVESCSIDPDIASVPWIHQIQWLAGPGTRIHATPGRRYFARAGFVVVTADSVAECEARMESVAARATVRTAPLALAKEA